jgi:hypothetical protein
VLFVLALQASAVAEPNVDQAAIVHIKVSGRDLQNQPLPKPRLGTGFFIRSDGYILTATHVIGTDDEWHDGEDHKPDRKIELILMSREGYLRNYIGDLNVPLADPRTDLAVLRISGTNYPVVHIAPKVHPYISEHIYVMGYGPYEDVRTLPGDVASLNEPEHGGILVTSQVLPGDSGAPVVDKSTNMAVAMVDGSAGNPAAIPVDWLPAQYLDQPSAQGGVVDNAQGGNVALTLTSDELAIVKELGLKYIILSATMQVKLTANGNEREARVRTVYVLMPLADITLNDPVFTEEYHSMTSGVRIVHMPGTETQAMKEDNPQEKKFGVKFEATAGVPRTLVTGAKYLFHMPLADHRSVHAFRDLSSSEDAWCYPNDSDIIRELTIIVESDDFRIWPCDTHGSLREGQVRGQVEFGDATEHVGEGVPRSGWTVSHRWTNVGPNELVGVCYQW